MSISIRVAAAVAFVVFSGRAVGQNISSVIVGDGWEAFRGVEYRGGDAAFTKKKLGALVLTDTMISFYECENSGCYMPKAGAPHKGPPIFEIPIRNITTAISSTLSIGDQFFGNAALGKDELIESVVISYETTKTGEAPMFKTQLSQSASIVAKINFRRKKMGLKVEAK